MQSHHYVATTAEDRGKVDSSVQEISPQAKAMEVSMQIDSTKTLSTIFFGNIKSWAQHRIAETNIKVKEVSFTERQEYAMRSRSKPRLLGSRHQLCLESLG